MIKLPNPISRVCDPLIMPRHNDDEAEVCLRCGGFGHDMTLCKYEYSHEDLKNIKCYVCNSLGHLCCIEPGHTQSWTVSCYRCGQLGHTGLACGRHYDDSVSPSCFICGREGHFEHQCHNSFSVCFPEDSSEDECQGPDSSSVRFQENTREEEEGHFEHQCPDSSSVCFPEINREEGYISLNSSSKSTSKGRETRRLCYECKGKGHIARDCPNSSQVGSMISLSTFGALSYSLLSFLSYCYSRINFSLFFSG
ncbi:putative transcription factor interactor and regulator CCHC(Zn) family [Arabidopsis thaliana]